MLKYYFLKLLAEIMCDHSFKFKLNSLSEICQYKHIKPWKKMHQRTSDGNVENITWHHFGLQV